MWEGMQDGGVGGEKEGEGDLGSDEALESSVGSRPLKYLAWNVRHPTIQERPT